MLSTAWETTTTKKISLLHLLHKVIQRGSCFENNERILPRLSCRLAMLTVALLRLCFPESHCSNIFWLNVFILEELFVLFVFGFSPEDK